MRKITVDGVQYTYSIGKLIVNIRKDGKTIFRETVYDVAGVTPEQWERAAWKGYHYSITPKMIAEQIKGLV